MLCINLPKKAAFTEKDVAVHDRLVVGLKDRERSEKLQLQPDLTLKAGITRARQHEQVDVGVMTAGCVPFRADVPHDVWM